MENKKLLENTEKQIEMLDELFEEIVNEIKDYAKARIGTLIFDSNDLLAMARTKRELLYAREEINAVPLPCCYGEDCCYVENNCCVEEVNPEVTE